MKKSFLVLVHPAEDVDFLNTCQIPFDFLDRLGPTDSGWCDASTASIILMNEESLLFTVDNTEDELILKLKFMDRIKEYIQQD